MIASHSILNWLECEHMKLDELERLEQIAMSIVVQALRDYRREATIIFREETDLPQDIAEDITREAIESMGVSGMRVRLYGKVDVKKAVYIFLPEAHPVALMVDAKAEKRNGDRTATIQMSQTSMRVRMVRQNQDIDEPGKLQQEIRREDRLFYVVTIIVKFVYETFGSSGQRLHRIIVSCIPNGKLQNRYNPHTRDTIWRVGRDAPSRGEDFRVRLNYQSLREKAHWRVVEIACT